METWKSRAGGARRQARVITLWLSLIGLCAIPAYAPAGTLPDLSGPKLVSARVQEWGTSNRVIVTFSEPLLSSSVLDTNHYRLSLVGTANTVPVINVYGGGRRGEPSVTLLVATNHWHLGGVSNYVLTVRDVRDRHTNVIAPDSQVALSWPHYIPLLPVWAEWRYYPLPGFDLSIFNRNWTGCDFVPDSLWGRGPGAFYYGAPSPQTSCLFPLPLLTQVLNGLRVLLLRTSFNWPAELGSTAELSLLCTENDGDGLVFYLNGAEIVRENLPPPPIPVTAYTNFSVIVEFPYCPAWTVTVTNLLPGRNCLAAAVFQKDAVESGDVVFGCQVTGVQYIPGPLPTNPPPRLTIRPTDAHAFTLSWTGFGYALESTTNLPTPGTTSEPPVWTEVPNMSNPYTVIPDGCLRVFRLRK